MQNYIKVEKLSACGQCEAFTEGDIQKYHKQWEAQYVGPSKPPTFGWLRVAVLALYLLAAFVFLAWVCSAPAGDYTYDKATGYYVNAGQAYTQSYVWKWYQPAAYYSYGCWYQSPGYWYKEYSYSPVKVDYAAEDAEGRILRLAEIREKWVGDVAKINQRTQSNLLLADKLGLNQNIPNYGAGIFPFAAYGGGPQLNTGSVGSTAYARVDQRVDAYGQLLIPDAGPLLVGQQKLQESYQQYGDQASARLSANIGQVTRAAERVATINALGQASRADAEVHTRTTTVTPVIPKLDTGEPIPAPRAVTAKQSCVKCHGADGANRARFDLEAFVPGANKELDATVFKYVKPGGNAKAHCPPGAQLSWEQINEILTPAKP